MDETIRDLPALPLTTEAFAPYGRVVAPMEDGVPFGPDDAPLDFGGGTPRFYAMRLHGRPMVVRGITRHRRVTQLLASVGGAPWLLLVAPPLGLDEPDAAPALADIRAFAIPGDAAVMLYRGTWHAGPLFEAPEASFFNLELADTNVTDHQTIDLVAYHGVALRPVAG